MKTQENLIQRKIPYQPVSAKEVGIPSSPVGTGMPIPTDVNHAVRKLKKGDWEAVKVYVLRNGDNVDDQSVYVMLHPAEDADAVASTTSTKRPQSLLNSHRVRSLFGAIMLQTTLLFMILRRSY